MSTPFGLPSTNALCELTVENLRPTVNVYKNSKAKVAHPVPCPFKGRQQSRAVIYSIERPSPIVMQISAFVFMDDGPPHYIGPSPVLAFVLNLHFSCRGWHFSPPVIPIFATLTGIKYLLPGHVRYVRS